jgi:cytochrome c-type biogenesis protein CcmF
LGTALLHSAIVTEKRGAFKSWTILLAILTFSLSLLGTFIVRSGLLTSVHAFAVDPERGIYILGLLVLSIGGSLTLYAVRAPKMELGGLFAPISREGGLLLNNLLLALATATVLFGTLYPLFLEAVTGEKISVGPPFFNASFIPIMLPLVVLMGIGPFLSWKRADLLGVYQRLKWVFVFAMLCGLAVWYVQTKGPALAVLAMAIAIWLLVATLREWSLRIKLGQVGIKDSLDRLRRVPRSSHGMTLAHAGLAVCMFGFVGSSAWKSEEILFVEAGTQIEIAGFDVTFEGSERAQGPNYVASVGVLRVERNGRYITTLRPERRSYPVAQSQTTEAAIRSTPAGDLYASITEPANQEADGQWTLRILYEPLVGFVWLGSLMLVFGGLLSLSDRRLRVGAPKRKTQNAPPVSTLEKV